MRMGNLIKGKQQIVMENEGDALSTEWSGECLSG